MVVFNKKRCNGKMIILITYKVYYIIYFPLNLYLLVVYPYNINLYIMLIYINLMENFSPEVNRIFNCININRTARLTFNQINLSSYRIIINSCIGQNDDETKSLYLNDLKKIVTIIGSIKRIFLEFITLYQKTILEINLFKLLNKLQEIIFKYNLNIDTIFNSFIESDDLYLNIIESNELILPELSFIEEVVDRMKIRLETLFLETDENILISNIFDSYLNLIYLKKMFNNYLSIIDNTTNNNDYIKITNKITELDLIIEKFISDNQFIKNYINFNNNTKKEIRINIRKNLFNALFC